MTVRRCAQVAAFLAALAALFAVVPAASAAACTWNCNTSGAIVLDGSGTWDTSATHWWSNSGGTEQSWSNTSGTDTAVFGTGSIASNPYTVSVASGGISAGGIVFQNQAYTLTGGTITLGGSAPAITVNATAGTIASVLAGAAGITTSGSGMLTLAAANTYTGVTILGGGVAQVASLSGGATASPLGAASGAAANIVFNGATLDYTGATTKWQRAFTLNSGGGSIEVASAAATLTIMPSVTGANIAGSGGLTMLGPGTLAIMPNSADSTAPSFTGGVTVNGGTLQLSAGNGISGSGLGNATVNPGGTLSIAESGGTNVQPFGHANTINMYGGGTLSLSVSATPGGPAQLQDNENFVGAVNLNSSNGTAAQVATTNGSGFRMGGGTIGTITSTGPVPNIWSAELRLRNKAGGTTGGTVTISPGAGNTLLMSGMIDEYNEHPGVGNGGAAVYKTGAGLLVLSGSNTYTGPTYITAGTLNAASNTALGFGGGTEINISGAATVSGTAAAATLDLAGAATVSKAIVLNGGANGASLVVSSGTATLGNGVAEIDFTNGGTGSSGTAGTVTLSGGGGTGAAATTFTVSGGSVQSIAMISAGSAYTSAPTIKFSSGSGQAAAAVLSSLTLTGTNNSLGGAGTMVIAANISQNAAGSGFTDIGPGTLVLAGDNTYSGGTTVSGGILQLGNSAALGTGGLTANRGTVNLAGFSPSVASLSGGSGTITNNGGGGAQLTVTQNGTTTFSGTLRDGAGKTSLFLTGTGTLVLNNANTFSGTVAVANIRDLGSIVAANPLALQYASLGNYNDNSLAFASGLGTATLGGFAGAAQAQSLTDLGGNAVTLCAGNNNANSTFSGADGARRSEQGRHGHVDPVAGAAGARRRRSQHQQRPQLPRVRHPGAGQQQHSDLRSGRQPDAQRRHAGHHGRHRVVDRRRIERRQRPALHHPRRRWPDRHAQRGRADAQQPVDPAVRHQRHGQSRPDYR